MPPLRERKDDILILVGYFVQRFANRAGEKPIDRAGDHGSVAVLRLAWQHPGVAEHN
jgi:transcriptional regulator with GAF, ATPase, and Fis domain